MAVMRAIFKGSILRAMTTVDTASVTAEQNSMPDPWSQYLNKVNQQVSQGLHYGLRLITYIPSNCVVESS